MQTLRRNSRIVVVVITIIIIITISRLSTPRGRREASSTTCGCVRTCQRARRSWCRSTFWLWLDRYRADHHTDARPGSIPGTVLPPGVTRGNGADVVPGKSRTKTFLGTSARLLPGYFLARFVLVTEIPAQLPPSEQPGGMVPSAVPDTYSRIRKHLGTSAGLQPGDLHPSTAQRNSLPVNYLGEWCLVWCRVHAGSERSTSAQEPGCCQVTS